jgi:hypothetical protein
VIRVMSDEQKKLKELEMGYIVLMIVKFFRVSEFQLLAGSVL